MDTIAQLLKGQIRQKFAVLIPKQGRPAEALRHQLTIALF